MLEVGDLSGERAIRCATRYVLRPARRCEELCDDDTLAWDRVSNLTFFTKRVAVRAVELSTGASCTEFRCEQLCDDDIFLDRGQILDFSLNGSP